MFHQFKNFIWNEGKNLFSFFKVFISFFFGVRKLIRGIIKGDLISSEELSDWLWSEAVICRNQEQQEANLKNYSNALEYQKEARAYEFLADIVVKEKWKT